MRKFGQTATTLLLILFAIVPFQKPLFHKALKSFSLSIIPSSLAMPPYFSTKMSFFLSDLLLVLLFLCIMTQSKGKWAEFFWSGPSKYLTLLFITALFSLGVSNTSQYLLMYTRFFQVVLIAVLFNSIKMLFDRENIGLFLKSVAVTLFVVSLFESLLAIAQYFSQSKVGLSFLGEQSRTYFAFHMPGGSISLLDSLLHIQRKSELLLRSTGTFPHPNIFGGFQFCALLASFYLYFLQGKYKSLILSGIFIQMLALTLSFSRAAVIALFFSTALYFLLQFRFPEKRKAVKTLTFLLMAASTFCLVLFYQQLFARGGIVNYNQIVQSADAERLAYQKIAIDMIKERPFFGVGLNNFEIESHRFFPDGRVFPFRVHNIYLLLAVETGLIGSFCFLLFLFAILKNVFQCLHSPHGLFLLCVFTGFLFIGLCDYYFISTPHGRILFFGTAALLFTATHLQKSDEISYCTV